MTDIHTSRRALRIEHRQQRRAMRRRDAKTAARQMARQVFRSTEFRRAKHIALYLACDGEIDTWPVIRKIWQLNKRCYLPIVQDGQSMRFYRLRRNAAVCLRRWSLPEPESTREPIAAGQLDLVLLPLVAFDNKGNRLGRGGGYYDRYLGRLRRYRKAGGGGSRRPPLFGLAYAQQACEQIPAAAWDVPLDGVFTESTTTRFGG